MNRKGEGQSIDVSFGFAASNGFSPLAFRWFLAHVPSPKPFIHISTTHWIEILSFMGSTELNYVKSLSQLFHGFDCQFTHFSTILHTFPPFLNGKTLSPQIHPSTSIPRYQCKSFCTMSSHTQRSRETTKAVLNTCTANPDCFDPKVFVHPKQDRFE